MEDWKDDFEGLFLFCLLPLVLVAWVVAYCLMGEA
jgi:hypothetical protein